MWVSALSLLISWLIFILQSVLILFIVFWLIKQMTMGMCLSKKRLDGKVALITGGTSGIGFETALELARRGAEVIITGRDVKKGVAATEKIKSISNNTNIYFNQLDLSLMSNVQRFAKDLNKQFPKINYLINNAGMIGKYFGEGKDKRVDTKDGLELIMASNFFGHVLLTDLLLDQIYAAAAESSDEPARIINVSGGIHIWATMSLDDFDLNCRRREFTSLAQYCNSKLAQILYSNELARRFSCAGVNIETVCLHPGIVNTNFFRDNPDFNSPFLKWLRFLFKTSYQGCQTTVEAVLSEAKLNGAYLADCRSTWIYSRKLLGNQAAEKKFYKAVRKLLRLN